MLNDWRQQDIVKAEDVKKFTVSVIGAGAIGSFSVLSLSKLGVEAMRVYDEDGVDDHNLPNQFYRMQDAVNNKFKVDALNEIVKDFSDCNVLPVKKFYEGEMLDDMVIVCTDSMSSRKLVWEEFKKQQQCRYLIEARMGAEIAHLYTIKKNLVKSGEGEAYMISDGDIKFYESNLYTDDQAAQERCTAKAVIYNVLMISSLLCRSFKAIANNEKYWPRQIIFNMANMQEPSLVYMTTK